MSDRTAVRKALPLDRGSTILVVVHSGSGMSRAVVPVVLLALCRQRPDRRLTKSRGQNHARSRFIWWNGNQPKVKMPAFGSVVPGRCNCRHGAITRAHQGE